MNGTFVLVQAMVLISRWCLRTTSGLWTLANVAKHPVYFQPRADLAGDRLDDGDDVRDALCENGTWAGFDTAPTWEG